MISYKHQDEALEQERLIEQFQRDWPWEKAALARLGVVPNQSRSLRALSYGCGVGIDAATFLCEGYAESVEGWDCSGDVIRAASLRFGQKGLRFRHLDLLNSPPPPDAPRFDFILFRLVLLHIRWDVVPRILRQSVNLLREGGLLVVHDVDKARETVIPEGHEFDTIRKRILAYLIRCGNNPSVGTLMPQLFDNSGLKNIRFESCSLTRDHEGTRSSLVFSLNVRDDTTENGMLVSPDLWERASKNKVDGFQWTSYRVITVGEK